MVGESSSSLLLLLWLLTVLVSNVGAPAAKWPRVLVAALLLQQQHSCTTNFRTLRSVVADKQKMKMRLAVVVVAVAAVHILHTRGDDPDRPNRRTTIDAALLQAVPSTRVDSNDARSVVAVLACSNLRLGLRKCSGGKRLLLRGAAHTVESPQHRRHGANPEHSRAPSWSQNLREQTRPNDERKYPNIVAIHCGEEAPRLRSRCLLRSALMRLEKRTPKRRRHPTAVDLS